MATVTQFDSLAIHGLQALYAIETEIVHSLPEVIRAATSEDLKEALQHHLTETHEHVLRLERIGQTTGIDVRAGEPSTVLEALFADGRKISTQFAPGPVLDAALIAASQKVEHLEIAAHGTAVTLAQQAGHRDVAGLLEQTLDEERHADKKLSNIAEANINKKALAGAAACAAFRPSKRNTVTGA